MAQGRTIQLFFDLQLERSYLRAVRAVELRDRRNGDQVRERIEAQLADTEVGIGRLRLRHAGALPDEWLGRTLGLDEELTSVLWTAVSVACDPRVHPHAHALTGSPCDRGATLAMHAAIHGLDLERSRALVLAFSGKNPLVDHQLLVPATGGRVLPATPLAAPTRLIRFLCGDDAVDPLLLAAGGPVAPLADACFDARQEQALAHLAGAIARGGQHAVCLAGPDGTGRRTAVAAAAARAGRRVIAIDPRLAGSDEALAETLAALRRECLLSDAVPLLCDVEDAALLARCLARLPGLVVATVPTVMAGAGRRLVRLAWPEPDVSARAILWARALGPDAGALAGELPAIARRFRLGGGAISRAVDTARLVSGARGPARRPLEAADLLCGVRASMAERLGELATLVEPTQSWDDLVLPEDTLDLVRALVARVRHAHLVFDGWGMQRAAPRGQGVAALFSGPPGTGKTMVAGLVARELGLDLYQVDLSRILSKWVGETEKQLATLFEAAEAGHALLLFDEADSLFARRTEVNGANDRYANLEVNYLLQRIESFGGVAILTTNLETGIDPAVKRRLSAHIAFWAPDHDERVALWRRFLGGGVPLDDVDIDAVAASFPALTGGHIRNAALAAAFLAADEGRSVAQAHLVRGARGEYRTLGRVLAAETRPRN